MGLAAGHDAQCLEADADLLKSVRRIVPEVVLFCAAGEPAQIQRSVRLILTDSGPKPRVGVYEPAPHHAGPDVAIERWGADGWAAEPSAAGALVDALLRGAGPVRMGTFTPGLLSRFLGKLPSKKWL